MTSFRKHFQNMRIGFSKILDTVVCVKFHQNRPKGPATKGCDSHTHIHTQTHTETDAQTGLIPGVNIFSKDVTKYKQEH